MFQFDLNKARWTAEPKSYKVVDGQKLIVKTAPETDLWQQTYYGFIHDNVPALLTETDEPFFSFTVKTEFDSKTLYDQCGVILYQDSENWFKASCEYENSEFQRLGSVVTNNGFSDWATTDIPAEIKTIFYRLSRKQSDYCIESSFDGRSFKQMRIFHLFSGDGKIHFGLYACSPMKASFTAEFSQMKITECLWK